MKKIFLLFIFIIFLFENCFACEKQVINDIYLVNGTSLGYDLNFCSYDKIRNLKHYEPVPKNLQDKYVRIIPKNFQKDYQADMDKALQHILYDRITYNNKTLKQMLLDFDNEADIIYKSYLNNKNNNEQNKIFLEKLTTMNGTISLYPDVIIEQIQPYINKYNLELEPGAEADIFLYKYYIEKYQLKYSDKLKNLLELKECIYMKINLYISELSNKN